MSMIDRFPVKAEAAPCVHTMPNIVRIDTRICQFFILIGFNYLHCATQIILIIMTSTSDLSGQWNIPTLPSSFL